MTSSSTSPVLLNDVGVSAKEKEERESGTIGYRGAEKDGDPVVAILLLDFHHAKGPAGGTL